VAIWKRCCAEQSVGFSLCFCFCKLFVYQNTKREYICAYRLANLLEEHFVLKRKTEYYWNMGIPEQRRMKHRSIQWKYADSQRPKKNLNNKSEVKIILICAFYKEYIMHCEFFFYTRRMLRFRARLQLWDRRRLSLLVGPIEFIS
jgi:hypothetical protein